VVIEQSSSPFTAHLSGIHHSPSRARTVARRASIQEKIHAPWF
jgi:hypothetical protein